MEGKTKEFNNLYKYLEKDRVHKNILNNNELKSLKIQLLNEEDIIVCLYLVAIDYRDIKFIININRVSRNDIIYNIYKRKLLNKDRLKKIIYISTYVIQFKITPNLLIALIENNEIELLNLIFKKHVI
ncbi:hypothetical protein PIROE2DRAFT_67767 [Piromyces sp. E2]|nr:hypothetical protein PIROE2DRAFT_67767 [Piromyces sp. E2]|eukprot:OUM58221.1 hypothetical protein PIROE2DRAFT_67767 [Piromyces sp. E2]